MKPEISIIMPVLNGERFIGEAIQSILQQKYRNCELIVIDDGSTDGTREAVNAFMDKMTIRYVEHAARMGIARSMNDGIRHASGNFIAFLDHDDAWFPEFLETQMAHLARFPEVGMVHSDFQTVDVDGKVLEESVARCRGRSRPSGQVFRQLFMDSFIVGNSVLIRRECFTRLGLFDEDLRWGDYHMWMRIAGHYKVDYVDKVLTKYRQHATQSTRTVAVGRRDEDSVGLQAIKKILVQYPETRQEIGGKNINRRMAALYCDLATTRYMQGAGANARWCYGKAIGLWPCHTRYYFLYAATLLRPSDVIGGKNAWRRLRGLFSSRKSRAGHLEEMQNAAK